MKAIFLGVILALAEVLGLQSAGAQTDDKPAPEAPYLAPVPDYGHWVVKFKYKASSPAPTPDAPGKAAVQAPSTPSAPGAEPAATAAPASSAPDGFPVSIETIKTGELRGVVLTFANGTTKQYTCQGNWVLTSTPKGAQLTVANPSSAPYIFYTQGFILLDGAKIDPSTFKEAKLHNGTMAFHYISADTEAWISPASMLPLDVKQAGVEASYQFLTPPPRPFPIPSDQATFLQKEQQAYQSTRSMR